MRKRTLYKIGEYDLEKIILPRQRDNEVYLTFSKDGKEILRIPYYYLCDLSDSLSDMQQSVD